MVASQGAKVPELKAIVPIAAISRWYGYAYSNGVRYLGNSEHVTDEGFDTPLAFDFGLTRTPPTDPDDPRFAEKLASRANPCSAADHTVKGYDTSPDYDDFWVERDYRRKASSFRAATLIAHGWQDYNVKQEEGVELFEAIPVRGKGKGRSSGVPLKRMWLWQAPHSSPSGDEWDELLTDFFDRYLLGRASGVERTPLVITQGRTVSDSGSFEDLDYRAERSWPAKQSMTWFLRRTFDQDIPGVTVPGPGTGETGLLSDTPNREAKDNVFTWVGGPTSEEVTTRDPLNEPGHGYYSLFFGTTPLSRDVRILGAPVLEAKVNTPDGGHLAPVLVDVAPDGTMTTIARGFLNVDYRDGLESAKTGARFVTARVQFLPQDVTVQKGHRLGLIVQSANTVWAAPGTPGAHNIATGPVPEEGVRGGSSLTIPVAGA
jgi:X-Pro dipeptidyl-peptidase